MARAKKKTPTAQDFGLAVLHNQLARCNSDLSTTAFRLILLMADHVRQDGELTPFTLRVADYRQRLVVTDMEYDCPIGKLALEVGRHSAPARVKIAENFVAWRGHIRQCLEDASERLPLSVDLDGLATFVLTTMEGAVMQARTHRDMSYYDASISHLRSYFEYLLSEKLTEETHET